MPPRVTKEEKELLLIRKEWEAAKIVYEEALQEIQDALEDVPQDKVKIQVMLASFQDDINDYMAVYQKINTALLNAPSRQVEHQESVKDAAKVKRDATRLMTTAKLIFEPDEDTASLRSTASDSGDSRSRRKLPKLNLPRFSGNNRDWLPFWSQFKEIHEDASIPVIDKFHYFIQCMEEGSLAKTIVLSYPVTSDNYQLAVDDVKDRYKDNILIKVYVRDLIKLVIENAAQKQRLDFSTLYVQLSSQLRALGSLGVTTEKCATIIYPIVECCIPADVLRAYQRARGSNEGINEDSEEELKGLMAFLKREVGGEDNIQLAGEGLSKRDNVLEVKKVGQGRYTNVPTAAGLFSADTSATSGKECIFCRNNHPSAACRKASDMTLEEKRSIIVDKRRCFVCLGYGHTARRCRSKVACVNCSGRHEVVMCPNLMKNQLHHKGNEEADNPSVDEAVAGSTSLANQTTSEVLLQTLKVKIRTENKIHVLRALIDTGSQKSYITKEVALKLNLKSTGIEDVVHALFGGYQSQIQSHNRYKVFLSDLEETYGCNFEVSDIEIISGHINGVPPGPWIHHLARCGVQLSDTGVSGGKVDLLIGADVAGRLYTGKKIQLDCGAVAVQTLLGWTLMGKIQKRKLNNEIGNYLSVSMLNQYTTSVLNTLHVGDCAIEKLWKLDALGIQDPTQEKTSLESAEEAMKHFRATVKVNTENRIEVELPWIEQKHFLPSNKWMAERRLITTTNRLLQDQTFEAYDKLLRYWEECGMTEEVPLPEESNWGHFLPHRAVYNPSSTTTPIRPVFDASCKQKGKLSLNDCLEKGLNLLEEIPTIITRFRLARVGVISDITKAFQQISVAMKDRDALRFLWWADNTRSKMKIYRHRRVVFGVNSSPFLLAATLDFVLSHAPLELQATSEKLRRSLYVDNVAASVDSMEKAERFKAEAISLLSTVQFQLRGWEIGPSEEDREVSLLGLKWNLKTDEIFCSVEKLELSKKVMTRRQILSTANSVYDPIGFLSPFLVTIKVLLQESWKLRISWDTEVPNSIQEQCERWKQQLPMLSDIRVPRWVPGTNQDHTGWALHIFVDGSKTAYAAAAFLRIRKDDGVTVQLLHAKARVAPLQSVTIPRLELLACLIGSRLSSMVKRILDLQDIATCFWTDSSTALHWIKNEGNWGVFVRNRVAEIRKLTNVCDWKHIPGEYNPADLPSRGCSIAQLLKSRWWEGPHWLKLKSTEWPTSDVHEEHSEIDAERTALSTTMSNVASVDSEMYAELCKCSSYESMVEHYKKRYMHIGNLQTLECEKKILKLVQDVKLKSDKGSRKKFQTFRDDSTGLIRIRSRLGYGNLSDSFKYPILLPADCLIVEALVMRSHLEHCHGGVQFLLAKLREDYWIVCGRRVIRKVIGKCANCQRFDAKKVVTDPASLPSDRIDAASPFEVTGVDLCGPLLLKNRQKVWIVLFTCAVYRAVHLELVNTLSTAGFKSALRRFVNRRGKPKTIFSDNGTNFVGCSNEMKKVDWKNIEDSAPGREIKWNFIPPAAPWWGGWWERMVGVVKNVLRRVMGQSVLNQHELITVLTDVEAVVNQRPLTYVSGSPDDLKPLSPSMFLLGEKDIHLSKLEYADGVGLNRRLRYMQRIREDLRARFKNEYIGQLMNMKHKTTSQKLRVGEVVLVEQDNCKRVMWPIGKITEAFPGKDGVVRVVKVKTADGEFTRPVQRIYQLEVAEKGGAKQLESSSFLGIQRSCSVTS